MQTKWQKAKAKRAAYLRHRHELYLAWKARRVSARRKMARKLKRAA